MTTADKMPELPNTEWLLHMPAMPYEPAWTSSQRGYDESDMHAYARAYAAQEVAKERALRCSDGMAHAAADEWDAWKEGGNQGTYECFQAVVNAAILARTA